MEKLNLESKNSLEFIENVGNMMMRLADEGNYDVWDLK